MRFFGVLISLCVLAALTRPGPAAQASNAGLPASGYPEELTRALREFQASPKAGQLPVLAPYLAVDSPAVLEAARAAILATPGWKSAALLLTRSQSRADRVAGMNVLCLDRTDENFAREMARLLVDPDPRVRSRAAGLSAGWSSDAAAAIHKAMARRLLVEPEAAIRYSLATALAREAGPADLAALESASRDAEPMVRESAIHGLGGLSAAGKDERAARRLLEIAQTGDERERAVAFYYVGRHGGEAGRVALRKIASGSWGSETLRKLADQAAREAEGAK